MPASHPLFQIATLYWECLPPTPYLRLHPLIANAYQPPLIQDYHLYMGDACFLPLIQDCLPYMVEACLLPLIQDCRLYMAEACLPPLIQVNSGEK